MDDERSSRVLVVDDEPLVRRALRSMLDAVCATVPAGSFEEARVVIEDGAPLAALIVDVQLGSRSGWDLIALVRERDPLVPVMMLTGASVADLARRAYAANVVAYEKPLEREHARRFVQDATTARAQGTARLRALVTRVADKAGLSATEACVVEALLRGLPRGELPDGRTITESTHKTHAKHICRKTGYGSMGPLRDALLRRFFGE
jgi:FixJ family two-component response regulator